MISNDAKRAPKECLRVWQSTFAKPIKAGVLPNRKSSRLCVRDSKTGSTQLTFAISRKKPSRARTTVHLWTSKKKKRRTLLSNHRIHRHSTLTLKARTESLSKQGPNWAKPRPNWLRHTTKLQPLKATTKPYSNKKYSGWSTWPNKYEQCFHMRTRPSESETYFPLRMLKL